MIATEPSADTLLLATASPRRIEMLGALGLDLETLPADVDESVYDGLPVGQRVVALAELKVRTSVSLWPQRNPGAVMPRFALGADTLVSIGGRTLGKPASVSEAAAMLGRLSGSTHRVSTGMCAIDATSGRIERALSETEVTFASISDREIREYLETGEWEGAAGAYRVQGRAAYFVSRIEGSFSGVVGLPLHEFYAILSRLGFRFP